MKTKGGRKQPKDKLSRIIFMKKKKKIKIHITELKGCQLI